MNLEHAFLDVPLEAYHLQLPDLSREYGAKGDRQTGTQIDRYTHTYTPTPTHTEQRERERERVRDRVTCRHMRLWNQRFLGKGKNAVRDSRAPRLTRLRTQHKPSRRTARLDKVQVPN